MGWSLLISCARGTRGLRGIGRKQADDPSCSQSPHDQKGGLVPHQLAALPKQIAKGAFRFRINVARGKQIEAEQMREPPGVVPIIGGLQSAVLR